MDRKIGRTLIAALLFAVVASAAQRGGAQPAQTTLDGVFTDAQAKRGESEYDANCARCHEGECPEGPPLSMQLFTERWRR